ncbi:hypothetical protein [Bradyrhizobium sp. USDA 4529]
MTEVVGPVVQVEVSERIANSIGPAFEVFATISGVLPFDFEPASFLQIQLLEIGK